MPKYQRLNALLKYEPRALNFFLSLPNAVRDQIARNGQHIGSVDGLYDYAERISATMKSL